MQTGNNLDVPEQYHGGCNAKILLIWVAEIEFVGNVAVPSCKSEAIVYITKYSLGEVKAIREQKYFSGAFLKFKSGAVHTFGSCRKLKRSY
jgi:hypothetical protein